MVKVLLINPPKPKIRGNRYAVDRYERCECVAEANILPPLDLAYSASILRKETNVDVKLLDAHALDMTQKEAGEEIKRYAPDVAVSKGVLSVLDSDLVGLKYAKESNPDCKTILRSVSSIGVEKKLLKKYNHLDSVCRAELEAVISDIVSDPELPGVIPFKKTEDLDELPFPAWDMLAPMERYRGTPNIGKWFMVLSSKGCPGNCSFCIIGGNRFTDFGYRTRKPELVVDEIEILINEYGIDSYLFFDETFTVPGHCEKVCRELIDRGIDIPWQCNGRVDLVDRKMLELMKKAGCNGVDYGVESVDKKILSNCNKDYNLSKEQIEKKLELTKDVGLRCNASFVIGLPGETEETFKKALDVVKKGCIDDGFFTTATPYPCTELHEQLKNKGNLLSEDWSRYEQVQSKEPVIRTDSLSSSELLEMQNRMYEANSKLRWRNVKRGLKNPSLVFNYLKSLLKEKIFDLEYKR